MEFWLASSAGEGVVDVLDGCHQTGCSPVLEGPEQNLIAVVIISNKEVVVALTGGNW